MKYIVSLIVENKHGVLAKVSQVITGRGYNITTLTVGPSEQADTSRMIITFDAEEGLIEQILKQMNKLIDVIKVSLIDEKDKIERELALIRMRRKSDTEESLMRVIHVFEGRIVGMTPKEIIAEFTGQCSEIDNIIENLKPYGGKEFMRSGPIALSS